MLNVTFIDPVEVANYLTETQSEHSNTTVRKVIWGSKGIPSEEDHEATLKLLELRLKFAEKFSNKKTSHFRIWQEIATEMTKAGYNLGKKDAATKCRQKFTNLQNKVYYPFVKHINNTGAERKAPPLYFNELQSILGDKHKSNPTYLSDSEESSSSVAKNNSDIEDATEIKNRFKKTESSVRPKSANTQLMELLERDREDRNAQMNAILDIARQQMEQKERLLKILEASLDMPKK